MSNRPLASLFWKQALNMFPREPKNKKKWTTKSTIITLIITGILIHIWAYYSSSDYKQFIKETFLQKKEETSIVDLDQDDYKPLPQKREKKSGAPKIEYKSSIVIYNPSNQKIEFIDDSGKPIKALTIAEYDKINELFWDARKLLSERHIGNNKISNLLRNELDKNVFEFYGLILQEWGFHSDNRDQSKSGGRWPCQLEESALSEVKKYVSELDGKELSSLTEAENIAIGFIYRYHVIERFLKAQLSKVWLSYERNIAEKSKFLNGVYNTGIWNFWECLSQLTKNNILNRTSLKTRSEFVALVKKHCESNILASEDHRWEYPERVDQYGRWFKMLSMKEIIDEPSSSTPVDRERRKEIVKSKVLDYIWTDYGHDNGNGNIDCSQLICKGLKSAWLKKWSFQPKEYLANAMIDFYLNRAWATLKTELRDINEWDLIFWYEEERDGDKHPESKMYHVALALSTVKQDLESGKFYCRTIESTTDPWGTGASEGVKIYENRELLPWRHVAIAGEVVYNTVLRDYDSWPVQPLSNN